MKLNKFYLDTFDENNKVVLLHKNSYPDTFNVNNNVVLLFKVVKSDMFFVIIMYYYLM